MPPILRLWLLAVTVVLLITQPLPASSAVRCPTVCGGTVVSFPFYLVDGCGPPGFRLLCNSRTGHLYANIYHNALRVLALGADHLVVDSTTTESYMCTTNSTTRSRTYPLAPDGPYFFSPDNVVLIDPNITTEATYSYINPTTVQPVSMGYLHIDSQVLQCIVAPGGGSCNFGKLASCCYIRLPTRAKNITFGSINQCFGRPPKLLYANLFLEEQVIGLKLDFDPPIQAGAYSPRPDPMMCQTSCLPDWPTLRFPFAVGSLLNETCYGGLLYPLICDDGYGDLFLPTPSGVYRITNMSTPAEIQIDSSQLIARGCHGAKVDSGFLAVKLDPSGPLWFSHSNLVVSLGCFPRAAFASDVGGYQVCEAGCSQLDPGSMCDGFACCVLNFPQTSLHSRSINFTGGGACGDTYIGQKSPIRTSTNFALRLSYDSPYAPDAFSVASPSPNVQAESTPSNDNPKVIGISVSVTVGLCLVLGVLAGSIVLRHIKKVRKRVKLGVGVRPGSEWPSLNTPDGLWVGPDGAHWTLDSEAWGAQRRAKGTGDLGGGGGGKQLEVAVDCEVQIHSLMNVKCNSEEMARLTTNGERVVAEIRLRSSDYIGGGGFGRVYKWERLGTTYAVKVVIGPPEQLKELWREVALLKELRHPNIVQFIFAVANPPNEVFIVMEYLPLGSLYKFLHEDKRHLAPATRLHMALDCAKGMAFLHQLNVVHRDLKTANLLVCADGTVKVCDFGQARLLSGVHLTTENRAGTLSYTSPEALKNFQSHPKESDVFAFGVCLWEIMAGLRPWAGATEYQIVKGVALDNLRPEIPDDWDAALASLIRICWHKEPGERPSFEEIVERLAELHRQALAEECGGLSHDVLARVDLEHGVSARDGTARSRSGVLGAAAREESSDDPASGAPVWQPHWQTAMVEDRGVGDCCSSSQEVPLAPGGVLQREGVLQLQWCPRPGVEEGAGGGELQCADRPERSRGLASLTEWGVDTSTLLDAGGRREESGLWKDGERRGGVELHPDDDGG